MLILSLAATLPGIAQDQPVPPAPSTNSGGWRKFDPQKDQQQAQQPDQQAAAQPAIPPAADSGQPQDQAPPPPAQAPAPQGAYQQAPPPPAQAAPQGYQQAPPQPQAPPPPAPRYAPTTITLPIGTWITMRLNEPLSSNRNQAGDAFTGTLLEPLVSNGLLIARRGETVTGIVTEAKKAGHVSGVSHLKLELTGVQLADGRQIQIKTKLIERRGNTSYGRDAAAIGATTGVGAAIGAGVNGGVGAGVGAGAGLLVSTIGVLLTRGRPVVVGPETPLTFAMETPITLDNSQQAFQYATQQDYNPGYGAPARRPAYRSAYGPGYPPPPAPYGYYAPPVYGYPYYPYPYWGPSLYFGFGRWGRW